ncbi:hypothetical protein HK100_004627 [Physocladia obscura]|uniref:Uncharacterized protein n=1 Tax=Physocladia obscura TaxID=109957 RepID=A0AAD5SSH9_9FUNG|nr:hypothetical protein HK100_004627 [Physocladia obscura]
MGEIDVIFGTSKKPKASDVESLKPARAITTKAANTKAQKRTTTSVDNTQQQQQQNTIVAKPKKKKAKVEKIADPLNSDKGIDENKSKKVVETVDFRFAVPTTKPIPLKGKRDDDDGFADSRGMKSGSS